MRSLLSRLLGWLTGPPPRLRCNRRLWREGVAQLALRTGGSARESGAFLLGDTDPWGGQRIRDFIFYDDIDPHALSTGVVVIRQTALPRLWEVCRQRGYGVVADVHVHPGSFRQSLSDMENPVMPRAGHIAMILPNFASGEPVPGKIGVYEFLGGVRWADHSSHGENFVKLDGRQ